MKNLSGSDKQVAWAEDIRANMTAMMSEASAICVEEIEAERNGKNRDRLVIRYTNSKAIIDAGIAELGAVESAKWFIDNRGFVPTPLADGTYHCRATEEMSRGETTSIKSFNNNLKQCAESIAKKLS